MVDNIIHIVLARIEGAPSGTRGISLFIVPRHLSKADGSLEAGKNVVCSRLENKMGIHGSSTCEMTFDDSVGYLIGQENHGLHYMFTFMNTARIGVLTAFSLNIQPLFLVEPQPLIILKLYV